MEGFDDPARVRLHDREMAHRVLGGVGRDLRDPVVEVALADPAQHGVDELAPGLSPDEPGELHGLADRGVGRGAEEQHLLRAEPQDVENRRLDVGQRPRAARLDHGVEEPAATQRPVRQRRRERGVAAVQPGLGEHARRGQVRVRAVEVDRPQDVVGREPGRVGGMAVGAPLRRSGAVAAPLVHADVPSRAPAAGRLPARPVGGRHRPLALRAHLSEHDRVRRRADAHPVLLDTQLARGERGVLGERLHGTELEPLPGVRRPRTGGRGAGADLPVDPHRRLPPVDLGVLDRDLGGERHAVGGLANGGHDARVQGVHRRDEQPGTAVGEAREQVSRGVARADRLGHDAEHRAGVEALLEQERRGTGDVVAVPDGVLHGRGAAPRGQHREVQVDPAVPGDAQRRPRHQCAVGHDGAAVGGELAQPVEELRLTGTDGVSTSIPRSSASWATGERCRVRPRPEGASGRVTTATTS